MLEIRLATTPTELEAVYKFRYSIYIEEMGQSESYADHHNKRIIDSLDGPHANVLAAWDNNQIVGTLRSSFIRDGGVGDYLDYYHLQHLSRETLSKISISTRFMLHPAFRCGTLAGRLVCETYRIGLEQGLETNYCDCDPRVASFFARLGYVTVTENFVHPEFGLGSIMKLNLHDKEHLEQLRSPFHKILAKYCSRNTKELTV
jgi:predicted GNAT family N-acyltransferase